MKSLATFSTAVLTVALLAAPALGQTATDSAARIVELEHTLATLTNNATPAATDSAAVSQDLTTLEKRIKELEAQIAELQKAQEAPKLRLANSEEVERDMEPVALSSFYDSGYLVATSANGDFKYWFDGRVNLDFATYKGAENRLPTGAEVRRGRIGVKATLFKNWLAEVDLDFADNVIEIKDMWMGYAGFANSVIRVGNHKAPFSIESLTSSKYIPFIERSYIDAWGPDRLLGISYSRWGGIWQASAGVFGEPGGNFDDKDTYTGGGAGTSQGWSLVGRASVAPFHEKGRILHFGAAAAYRTPDRNAIATSGSDLVDRLNASRVVKLDSRAETHVLRAKFVSTGNMKYVDNTVLLGGEVAGVYGPLTLQGEYQKMKVNRLSTTVANYSDHEFSGYYGLVTCFLTGEVRPYSASEGEFGRVIPKRKYGAVEVGLRLSSIDLNDPTAVDAIYGGSAKNITGGLTWYMNPNHKLLFNVTMVNNDEYAKPGKDWAPLPMGTSTSLTPIVGDDFTTIAVRYQIAF